MFHLAPCSAVQDFDLANLGRYGKPALLIRRRGSKLKSNATSHAEVWWCGNCEGPAGPAKVGC